MTRDKRQRVLKKGYDDKAQYIELMMVIVCNNTCKFSFWVSWFDASILQKHLKSRSGNWPDRGSNWFPLREWWKLQLWSCRMIAILVLIFQFIVSLTLFLPPVNIGLSIFRLYTLFNFTFWLTRWLTSPFMPVTSFRLEVF